MFGNQVKKEQAYKRLIVWRILNATILLMCVLFIDYVFAMVYPNLEMFYTSYALEMSPISLLLPKLIIFITIVALVFIAFEILMMPRKKEIEIQLAQHDGEYVDIKKLNKKVYDYIGYIIIIVMTILILFGAIIPTKVQIS